ncbi:hypothetical protein RMR16_008630 [Agrobacterium sp. rho-13.3]|uniref:hypothetical protein n=1 Tax=Agrobacterium sp. rho-13.3 TaxID=3072980 RepID=UPI002A116A87|nr:hypothetical protein [Agrobacterium sp. rho-13.3]MDX8310015.1 hypothetical protein [Agrobacterium sp. rho-13.3]
MNAIIPPVMTTNISHQVPVSDELLVNRDGSTAVQTTNDLAVQLAATSPLDLGGFQAPLFATEAALNAAVLTNKVSAWVYDDPGADKNGIWSWDGTAWVWTLPLPYSISVLRNAGAETPNAIVATSKVPLVEGLIVVLPITATTTATPVTVKVNGGKTFIIKTLTGNDIIPGGLVEQMMVLALVSGDNLRLISDQASAAIVAAAENAAERAEQAAESLEGVSFSILNTRYVTGLTADPVNNSQRLLAAWAEWGALNAGRIDINFPAGSYKFSPIQAYAVGVDEGLILPMSAGGRVNFVGRGTILIPASNRIEMFVQDGAVEIGYHNLTFDNSQNGVLQNTAKPAVLTKGGGVAGLGNAANAAIRQYRGATVELDDVVFRSFNVCLNYYGNFDNNQSLVGRVRSNQVRTEGCCFGHLLHQERELTMTNGVCLDNLDSINSSGSTLRDPGHFLYQTDRDGAKPQLVTINGIQSRGGQSSALKLRKGQTVTISDVVVSGDGRGIEISNIQNGGAISNFSIKLADFSSIDTNQNGLEVSDCGELEVQNGVIDIRGCNAWGVRVRRDIGSENWQNTGQTFTHLTVIHDFALPTGVGKAAFIASNQADLILEDFRFVHKGVIANTRHPVDIASCTRARIFDVTHDAPSNPTDRATLISFDDASVNCFADVYSSGLGHGLIATVGTTSASSVRANVGGHKVLVDGDLFGSFTPDLIGLTTAGTNSYSSRSGDFSRNGRRVRVWGQITLNAALASTGNLAISGLPYAVRNRSADFRGEVSFLSGVTLSQGSIPFLLSVRAQSYMALRKLDGGTASAIPAGSISGAAAQIIFDCEYETDDPF